VTHPHHPTHTLSGLRQDALALPADLTLPEDWGSLADRARTPRYGLIALDLDGTLFDRTGRVPAENAQAVAAARRAGIETVICTGRGFRESRHAIDSIRAYEPAAGRRVAPIVNAGGAMITDAASGRTLHRWPMAPELVADLCAYFAAHHRAPLLLKDRDAAGFDYLVVDTGPLEAPTRWWFQHMDVEVKFVGSIEDDPHPEHTVRVGFAALRDDMTTLAGSIARAFGDRVMMQHYPAVSASAPGSSSGTKDLSVQLLEVFDRQVSKWSAIRHIAAEHEIARERIAAIGDEINDQPMIEGAGLGIAMGNAVPGVLAVADALTRENSQAGVAWAIAAILRGDW
jgi:hydroxymethylpyrimidine pyrophosphatase-like HAD family hydrolase